MSVEGKIQSLFTDREQTQAIFPTTKVKAVTDDNGVGLNAILEDMLYAGDLTEETETAPVDADTLGGRLANEYATQNFVVAKIAEAQLGGDGGDDIDLSGYATKDEVSNHTNNKNNPHNVIAEQVGARPNTWLPTIAEIGAAPSGYGLGSEFGKSISDCDLAVENGYYQISASTLHRPDGMSTRCWMQVISYGSTYKTQICYSSSKAMQIREMNNGTWSEWTDISPSAFAPAGYGLGERAKLVTNTDLNNYTKGGCYAWEGSATNEPFLWGYMEVIPFSTGEGAWQIATCLMGNMLGCVAQRVCHSWGTWEPWEWVNPPMNLGVEYRTTERCEGKPVYAKRINCLAAPANVSISDLNIETLVRWSGHVSYYGVALPCSNASWKVDINRTTISTTSAYEQASAHFYIILYYTKN